MTPFRPRRASRFTHDAQVGNRFIGLRGIARLTIDDCLFSQANYLVSAEIPTRTWRCYHGDGEDHGDG